MKISFSTLGCPGFEWSDIYSMAKDFGFDGIEIRGMGKDIFHCFVILCRRKAECHSFPSMALNFL